MIVGTILFLVAAGAIWIFAEIYITERRNRKISREALRTIRKMRGVRFAETVVLKPKEYCRESD